MTVKRIKLWGGGGVKGAGCRVKGTVIYDSQLASNTKEKKNLSSNKKCDRGSRKAKKRDV